MKNAVFAVGLVLLGSTCAFEMRSVAQAQNATPLPPQRRMPQAYPDRQQAPQEVLDRGKAIYGVNCAFCHGSDAGGGETGPNLHRSQVVLNDKAGEMILPIVHGERAEKGMPRIPITDEQVSDIAAWLHSYHVASRTDPNENNIDIVRGNAKAGEAYFQKTCASCHSMTGDLAGFVAKMPNPKTLQQVWLLPDGGRGSNAPGGRGRAVPVVKTSPITVTVTLPSGQKVTGALTRIDDFFVGLTEADGTVRGFARNGSVPKLEIHDPLAAHRELLRHYQDKDIHDVTAYLMSVK